MTLLALSYHGTRLSVLQSVWKNRQLKQNQPQEELLPQEFLWIRERYAGGVFAVFDWEQNQVVWQIAIDAVAGFCWHQDLLYLNLMRLDEIVVLDGFGREQNRFSHPHLNNIHTIVPTQHGFLLTSSGTDSIIELDQQGTLLYEWCALDHGYAHSMNGEKRVLDRSRDHRQVTYITPSHTTHINSARFSDTNEQIILATLFQQGEIIAIEKQSGDVQQLVKGLRNPHDLRPMHNGWIVSDTGNNQTLLLDTNWQVRQRISLDFNWVQSSAALSDGSIVIADTNYNRLVRVYQNNLSTCEVRQYPPDWRIYQVEEVPPAYETFFQHPIAGPPL